jgi:tRNA(Ile)-lysidine synthase
VTILQNDKLAFEDEFMATRLRILYQFSKLKPKRVWLACSGGLDSMVLAHTLEDLVRAIEPDISLGLLHVNYGLRGEESEGDREFVAQYANARALELKILDVDK